MKRQKKDGNKTRSRPVHRNSASKPATKENLPEGIERLIIEHIGDEPEPTGPFGDNRHDDSAVDPNRV